MTRYQFLCTVLNLANCIPLQALFALALLMDFSIRYVRYETRRVQIATSHSSTLAYVSAGSRWARDIQEVSAIPFDLNSV
jgi:hypothetical protein